MLNHQFQQTGLAAASNAGYHLDRLGILEANQLLQINIALFQFVGIYHAEHLLWH